MHSAPHVMPAIDREPAVAAARSWTLKAIAGKAGRFLLHFAEMWIAMLIGMAVFVPVRLALVAQGYTALLDSGSIDYQAWMGGFMAVPMVLWMRARGHGWRMGTEMAGAMLVPMAVVLALCAHGAPDVLPWLTTQSSGTAMAIGMVALMLHRREHYTGGYAFIRLRRGPARPR